MEADILYNKLYTKVALRVAERLESYNLRKLMNMSLSGLLFHDGVFTVLIENLS